jgi:hypothetical protein
MQAMAQTFQIVEQAHPGLTTAKTTLYQLIEAISEEVKPGEDWLVVETVLDLIDTGQIVFLGSMGESVSCLSLN